MCPSRVIRVIGLDADISLRKLMFIPFFRRWGACPRGQDPHLRRNALRMFTARLDPDGRSKSRFSSGEEALLIDMLPPLSRVAIGRSRARSDEDAMDEDDDESGNGKENTLIRQTAMLSLDVLARVLGRRYQSAFMSVLDDMTEVIVAGEPGSPSGAFFDIGEHDTGWTMVPHPVSIVI